MTTSYQRIPLSDAIAFSEILDPKLKTNSLRIQFLQPLSEKNAAACGLGGSLIASSSKAYPSNAIMNRKLHMLYGADLSCSISKMGDVQVITLRTSSIADRYALEHEAVFSELTRILLGCIFEPNVTDGAFDETEFRIQQTNLLDCIDAEVNEKRQYAISQTHKTAFAGEPAAFSCYGTRESAEAMTPKAAYEAFQQLLRTAQIEIYFVGPEAVPQLADTLRQAFAAIADRKPVPVSFLSPSPCKPEPVTVREALPVNQCKMVMGWKTSYTDRYALKMMTMLLGGTPSSKLFANVREKMSLCYYCAANFNECKSFMQVDSGIETENLETAETAIAAQLEAQHHDDHSQHPLRCGRYCQQLYCMVFRAVLPRHQADTGGGRRTVPSGHQGGHHCGSKVHAAGYRLYYGMQRTGGGITWQKPRKRRSFPPRPVTSTPISTTKADWRS